MCIYILSSVSLCPCRFCFFLFVLYNENNDGFNYKLISKRFWLIRSLASWLWLIRSVSISWSEPNLEKPKHVRNISNYFICLFWFWLSSCLMRPSGMNQSNILGLGVTESFTISPTSIRLHLVWTSFRVQVQLYVLFSISWTLAHQNIRQFHNHMYSCLLISGKNSKTFHFYSPPPTMLFYFHKKLLEEKLKMIIKIAKLILYRL